MGFVFFCVLMFELRVWGERFLVPVPVGESASSGSEWATVVRLRRLELFGEWGASESPSGRWLSLALLFLCTDEFVSPLSVMRMQEDEQ